MYIFNAFNSSQIAIPHNGILNKIVCAIKVLKFKVSSVIEARYPDLNFYLRLINRLRIIGQMDCPAEWLSTALVIQGEMVLHK